MTKTVGRKSSKKNHQPQLPKRPPLEPKTERQRLYLNALKTSPQTIVLGPAGTGKTYIAASYASQMYLDKTIEKIVITRPHVSVGKEIGFLPGNVLEKATPWAMPTLDVLEQWMGKGVVETSLKNGNIEIAPLALMRGRSFENSFIIVDEAQNITTHEIKMLLTRVAEGSKIVLNGDVQQSDLKDANGLAKIVELSQRYAVNVPVIEFTIDDVVRSEVCKQWISIFMQEKI
jgi:phosphate starvation-inducible PhoH-like protein